MTFGPGQNHQRAQPTRPTAVAVSPVPELSLPHRRCGCCPKTLGERTTMEDENSIYVGGLPYDATEESLRRAFDLYGSVVAVKIINDREVGGRCYGFVTFTNPRSATNAITDMKGRTIGGRHVMVNEVRTKGGRSTFHRESFRRDAGRDTDWARDRDKDRVGDRIRSRDWYRDKDTDRSRDRSREREYGRGYNSDQGRDHASNRGQDLEEHDREPHGHDREWAREHDIERDRDREIDKPKDQYDGDGDKDKDQQSRNKPGFRISDRQRRELSSNSSDDYNNRVKELLESSIHRHDELQMEIDQIQETIEEKEQFVSELKGKSQMLSDALLDAKKLFSQQQIMLTKLHRSFLQGHDHAERLKSSEQELQSLVERATAEANKTDDANIKKGLAYANGNI